MCIMTRFARKFGAYDPFYDGYGWHVTTEDVKSILKTREHVPNKQEARKIRQECAKKHK